MSTGLDAAAADGRVPPPELGGLGELWLRLRGGTYPTFEAGRPAYAGFHDDQVLDGWPGERLAALDFLRSGSWGSGDQPEKTVEEIAEWMRSDRRLLAAVVFTPAEVLYRLRETRDAAPKGVVDAWAGMCWTAEAAWRAVTDDVPEPAAGDAIVLRPLAARLRFLILSEPMRWRGQAAVAWWGIQRDLEHLRGGGVVDRAFGPRTWPLLVSRCREARRQWQACLDDYQSHPLLAQAKPRELEQELSVLIFRHGHTGRLPDGPLGLPAPTVNETASLTAEDRAVLADVTDRHLLPRFALRTVASLALFDDEQWLRWSRRITAGAVALTAAAAVGCAAALIFTPAAILAAACYLLICAGIVVFPAEWGAMWLLRMPAASAVGIIALAGLLPGGWVAAPPRGWLAAGALAAVSLGYLLIEVRNHGVAPGTALLRSVLVALAGAVHAVLVSVIALGVVLPAFVSNNGTGKDLIAIWNQPGYGHAGMVLALAAAWCLAVGVFSQILWNDWPITATLAHLSWRRQ
jgi:hypothetical protein